ncbi:MAG: cysteine desulfurase [Christensenellaceae bacterium]|jgi:cysteine desulfurase|nr:cysteine desulfurase [Christensenellaceae bacterium]
MIYLDNAATTKVVPYVGEIIKKYNEEIYFNSASPYTNDLNVEIDNVKQNFIKKLDGDSSGRIIFTSGATESNNLAILGSLIDKKKAFVFAEGEHASVHSVAMHLKQQGIETRLVPLSDDGTINLTKLEEALDESVGFVSVMLASNETGAVNNIAEVSRLIKTKCPKARLHVDAVQGFCKMKFSCKKLGISLCTICAHKIHGPKGIGALYVAPKLMLKAISMGGEHEGSLRPGTQNTSGIMGFGRAVDYMFENFDEFNKHITHLKEEFIKGLGPVKDKIIINGNGLPHVLSLSIKGIMGQTLVNVLKEHDILITTGSACNAKHIENRALASMGRSKTDIVGSVRISFSHLNTLDEISQASRILVSGINKLLNI